MLFFKKEKKLKDKLSKKEIKNIILNKDCKNIQKRFVQMFKKEINVFIELSFDLHLLLVNLDKKYGKDIKKGYSLAFMNNAFQNIICSMSVYILGYPVPSGNLMRQFIESISMTILVINPNSKYFRKFKEKGTKYDVSKSPFIVRDNAERLHINESSWYTLLKRRQFFNLLSHPSAFALTYIINFADGGGTIGTDFDLVKIKNYKKDMDERINAIKWFKEFILDMEKLHWEQNNKNITGAVQA